MTGIIKNWNISCISFLRTLYTVRMPFTQMMAHSQKKKTLTPIPPITLETKL